jgi:glycosyltransferase involved in cell wall biosynthesis
MIALLFKLAGVKFVFDHHDLTPETYVAKYGAKSIVYRLLLWMERLSFLTADIVISTNESYKKIAIERGGKIESDVVVVRNGPNLPAIPVMKPDRRHLEGFRYLVGYVGIIGQQEGIENLLRASEYIVREKQRKDIKFAVVGSGPHLKNVVRKSRDMGLERYVHFFGYVPDRMLYEILETSDVCINPEYGNEFTEKSTMIKVMEYMTFGKPIVQFYTTESQVTAGESAVYIRNNDARQFADAILDLLDDPARRERMGRIGRKRIEELLNWDIQKQNLTTVYRRVIPKSYSCDPGFPRVF